MATINNNTELITYSALFMSARKISRALISVFYKDNLEPLINLLGKHSVEFISTGGTQEFIERLGFTVTPVEKLTGFPSIFGGRVKTLHPAVFGGILFKRDDSGHADAHDGLFDFVHSSRLLRHRRGLDGRHDGSHARSGLPDLRPG